MGELQKYRKFGGVQFLYHAFATSYGEAQVRKAGYQLRGYLVRVVKHNPHGDEIWYRIYIRSPKTGVRIKFDQNAMPVPI